jgi:hypothetical protein
LLLGENFFFDATCVGASDGKMRRKGEAEEERGEKRRSGEEKISISGLI